MPSVSMVDKGGVKSSRRTLILGAGWVGSRLATRLDSEGNSVTVTNRPGTNERMKPPYFRPVELPETVSQRREFDLDVRETWEMLPPPDQFDEVVVTFPLSTNTIDLFWHEYLSRIPNVVCYSSTAVYEVCPSFPCVHSCRLPSPHG